MSTETSVPCLVCGDVMSRVTPSAEAQPDDGLMCQTYGNYGSTIFDPENGEYLAFIICDTCMAKAGDRGRVLSSRSKQPVKIDGSLCGWMPVDSPYVPWHRGLAGYHEEINLDSDLPDEIESFANHPRIRWKVDPRHFAEQQRARRASEGNTR